MQYREFPYFSARKVPKAWALRYAHTLTLHKCGMLRLLQIAEILNLAHFVHSLEKFLRDSRKYLSTCCALEIYLLSAGCAIVIRVTEPTAACGRERKAEEGKVTSGQDWL